MRKFYTKKNCRLCNMTKLKTVIDFGKMPLPDEFLKTKNKNITYPIKLMNCQNCGFYQNSTVVNPKIIYKNYIYETTSSSKYLSDHFKSYAKKVIKKLKLNRNDYVLDIGSNDGTLLKFFKKTTKVVGVEPAKKIAIIANNSKIKTIPHYFNTNTVNTLKRNNIFPKVITLNNTFANIDNIYSLVKLIKKIMLHDSVLIIETSYTGDIVNKKIFDWIYHEHLSYFAINPLNKFFKKLQLEIFDIEKSNSKGGSVRIYIKRKNHKIKIKNIVNKYLKYEKITKLNTIQSFTKLKTIIDLEAKKIRNKIEKKNYRFIAGYGASATTTTLISYFKLGKKLNILFDDNYLKNNTFNPQNKIPVKKLDLNLDKKIDCIIILAWRYKKLILKKLKNLKYKKFDIIIPFE